MYLHLKFQFENLWISGDFSLRCSFVCVVGLLPKVYGHDDDAAELVIVYVCMVSLGRA